MSDGELPKSMMFLKHEKDICIPWLPKKMFKNIVTSRQYSPLVILVRNEYITGTYKSAQ